VRRASTHGLLGMRYRVEAGGGRFRLDSAPGRGTRIHASLPLRSAA
jgi:signal transduction histidine kinase